MMSKNLFIQIGMIAISVGIIVTFVKPMFTNISDLQDSIVVYQTERNKVSSVNTQLSSLINTLNSVSRDDQRKLLTYMPDQVDEISVVRDLSLIADEAGVVYLSATADGEMNNNSDSDDAESIKPIASGFSMTVEATYGQMKNLFRLLEQNNYPLEVQTISVQKKDGGFLTVDLGFSVYAHQAFIPNQAIEF